jgi:hypothetical protein
MTSGLQQVPAGYAASQHPAIAHRNVVSDTLLRIDRLAGDVDALLDDALADAAGIPAPAKRRYSAANATIPNAGLPGESFAVPSPDGHKLYVASRKSSWLVGFRVDSNNGRTEEFCRLQLGLQHGGIGDVAVGGPWVFAACDLSTRIFVLRLCHDWYQNRTRLLVMRIVEGGPRPDAICSTRDGSLVAVLHRSARQVQIYRCFVNGRLDSAAVVPVCQDASDIEFTPAADALAVRRTVGQMRISLESILGDSWNSGSVRA